MKVYVCGNCKNPLYFENSLCLSCKHPVGFDAETLSMITLDEKKPGEFVAMKGQQAYRFCENASHDTCNWLISPESDSPFCRACILNDTIPSLENPDNLFKWKRIEVAKHRLIYSLLRLRLPVAPKENNEGPGIAFDFMADVSPAQRVMTGHNEGTITLNIEEADEAERVRNKLDLGERYRTLLGHFRHEIGHYYWDLLIKDQPASDGFRKLFGDDRQDYAEALKTYYQNGAPTDWMDHFISPYASAHPWEDWAETWAHYLHMLDTLGTAHSFGLKPDGIALPFEAFRADVLAQIEPELIAHGQADDSTRFLSLLNGWLKLTSALNELSRGMGQPDFYPFVLPPPAVCKLYFVHTLIRAVAASLAA
jgi:hypothetical protein